MMIHIARILLLVVAFSMTGLVGWPVCDTPNVLAAAPSDAGQQQPPVADFSADRVEIRPDMEIRFTDESTGTITSWLWDFGDGSTSNEQNPVHVYRKNGYYTVTLKVTGPHGSDTVKKVEFIRVSEDCNC